MDNGMCSICYEREANAHSCCVKTCYDCEYRVFSLCYVCDRKLLNTEVKCDHCGDWLSFMTTRTCIKHNKKDGFCTRRFCEDCSFMQIYCSYKCYKLDE